MREFIIAKKKKTINKRRLEILGILTIAISLLILISMIGFHPNEDPGISPNIHVENPMGILGVYIAYFFIKLTFGAVMFILPVIGIVYGWRFFGQKDLNSLHRIAGYVLGGAFVLSVSIGLLLHLLMISGQPNFIWSGLTGGLLANLLVDFLGRIGAVIVLLAAWLVLFRGYFEWSFYQPIKELWEKLYHWKQEKSQKKDRKKEEAEKRKHTEGLIEKIDAQKVREAKELEQNTHDEMSEIDEEPQGESEEIESTKVPQPELPKLTDDEPIEVGEMVVEDEVDLDAVKERQAPKRKYQLPGTELLFTPVSINDGMSREELLDRASFLTQSLATFGVQGKVVNVHPGPVITLFEVEPAEGVRVNKFVQLSDDLARVMEASRVRVIAPIPGKSSVGIEIPNRNPAMVYFKSVVNSEKFANTDSKLTLAVGKNTSGEIATLNLAKMPHLLIAGTTGSGKSVCLNTVVCSLLYQCTPDEVKFMIIDPKKVEMTLYRALEGYYLVGTEDISEPIITTMENAILGLRALEKEMDKRYTVLADAVVRNIDEYNKRMRKENQPIMPYIVLIVDELADLMMMSAKDVEAPIARLAQLSRAVGIHLVIATQRPSVDVITGIIKANFPSRIAFQVASKIDSRTILDSQGAEKLIGRGDMLFQGLGSSEPIRLHNAFLSLEEIEAVMNHVKQQPKSDELKLDSVREVSAGGFALDSTGSDEMLNDAIRLVVIHQQGSISLLQRRLKVGYSRAARLIDEMEQLGVVGPFTGSKAREVLVDESYLEMIDD
ncbi:MAG: DNA translocase FtsK [Candidatus Marinimicrobia bacterium]|nr:DNA translocase FtsK [Candidatus Neomarinimicrobiota bacterium]